jgi:16S rRNA processing protein RimM
VPNQIPPDLIEIGRIADAYGIKGWVKVVPFAKSSDSSLKRTKRWWLTGSSLALVNDAKEILSSRVQGDTIVAEIMGVSDRDVALKFKGASVSVRRQDFAPSQSDEFYWVDLIGCLAVNAQGVVLGHVDEVFDNGAQSVLRIVLSAATATLLEPEHISEVLIPFADQFVAKVDLETKTIAVDWPLSWISSES